jgi:hypothetical protein
MQSEGDIALYLSPLDYDEMLRFLCSKFNQISEQLCLFAGICAERLFDKSNIQMFKSRTENSGQTEIDWHKGFW